MDLEARATATLEMMSGQLERNPLASGMALMALDFLIGPAWEIVIAEAPSSRVDQGPSTTEAGLRTTEPTRFIDELQKKFVPNKVIQRRSSELADDQLPSSVRSTLAGKVAQSGQPTIYICQRGVCERPIVDAVQLSAAIERL
jgi:uncharacterized protein YyaL (SSP411 family)